MEIAAAETNISRRLFTVEEYYRMAEVGIIRPEDRVELIGGEILNMAAAAGGWHSYVVFNLMNIFVRLLGNRAAVRVQDSVPMAPNNAPEPDVFLLHPPLSRYKGRLPAPDEILLVIEVADTSLNVDRKIKGPLYARYNVQEYWIVNINERQIEVHWQPDGEKYQSIDIRHEGETVSPLAFPDIQLAVAEILG